MQQQGSDNYAGLSSPPPEMLSFGGGGGSSHEHAEAASPISSRPPAASGNINFDELVAADHDRGGSSSGNRWPRQETLALLKIRSDMDVAFRDSTLKGPLWDEVSRKLGELGYVRSAKKCKEKFENVQKYYKRTKEGRAGRQDGKTYRFFTQLEAMQAPSGSPNLMLPSYTTSQQQAVATSGPMTSVPSTSGGNMVQFATPVSVGIGGAGGGVMQSGSVPFQPFTVYSSGVSSGGATVLPPAAGVPVGINFSSDSASSGSSDSDDEVDDMMSDEELDQPAGSGQKRKRSSGGMKVGKRSRLMDFFERLMKQVMQKQEAMQQKFLETIEKREQDRLMREEAWKQHEAERLWREQQLAAQERAMAASRDAAIVSFLHKITGQTIQLPPQPKPQPQPQPIYTATTFQHVGPTPTPASAPLQSRQQKLQPENNTELVIRQQQNNQMPPPQVVPGNNDQVIMAVPERQIPPQGQDAGSSEPASSRWPKAEVLALIKLRSNLENRYLEAGPKGPLWEEISSGMHRIGYNRSSKRCKEKWENINKYFKKVKESNKKRPEDAKTCPYFNELDALYQRKKLGSSSGSSIVQPQQQQQATNYSGHTELDGTPAHPIPESGVQQERTIFPHVEPITERAEGSSDQVQPNNVGGQDDDVPVGSGKPEDIMMEQKQLDLEEKYNHQKLNELGDNSADDEDDEQVSEEENKMEYKIDQFQRPPTNNKNGEAPSSSFNITMVQ